MTFFKSTFILTTTAIAMAAAPAFAGHHEGGHTMDAMAKAEMMAKCKTMMKMDAEAQMKAAAANPDMAAKCKVMMDAKMDGTHVKHHDNKMMETGMKSHKGMKPHKGMKHSMSMEQKAAMKADIMNSMSAEEKAAWPTMSQTDRDAWVKTRMKARTKTKHQMHTDGAMMKSDAMVDGETMGEILQDNGEMNRGNNTVVMSNGDVKMRSKVKAMDGDGSLLDNAIPVATIGSNTITTVLCPAGTTAQPDNTCMITGDYNWK